jgi:hypothetical protein
VTVSLRKKAGAIENMITSVVMVDSFHGCIQYGCVAHEKKASYVYGRIVQERSEVAVSTDLTGSVLPDPDSWKPWFTQDVDPAGCTSKSDLLVWQAAFARDGYYEFTRRSA